MSLRREAPPSATEARLQTLEARTMIHSDSLTRLWGRVGNKMRVETSAPVYVEPLSAPMGARMRKVLETGCMRRGTAGLADAPCAAVVMYGSMPNTVYYYTSKQASQFGQLSHAVTDMTHDMKRSYEGFYGHMTGTMGYSNVYTYSYDGKMNIDDMLSKMYASRYNGTYGENWYGDMMAHGEKYGDAAYPYMTDGDMMFRIKMYA